MKTHCKMKETQARAEKAPRRFGFGKHRTFAAAVGTTAVLMLTVCGVFDLYLTQEDGPENVRAASVFGGPTESAQSRTVQLGGDVFGIKLFSDGVIVAALSDIYTENAVCCPAKDAGIEAGDYVLSANGAPVETNAALAAVLSSGDAVSLTMRRGDRTYETTLTPARAGGAFKAGMWIRDSAAGIGTVTFYSADGASFAALGHGICDSDTKDVLAIRTRRAGGHFHLRHRAGPNRRAGPPARVLHRRRQSRRAHAEHRTRHLRYAENAAQRADGRGARPRGRAHRSRADRGDDR